MIQAVISHDQLVKKWWCRATTILLEWYGMLKRDSKSEPCYRLDPLVRKDEFLIDDYVSIPMITFGP